MSTSKGPLSSRITQKKNCPKEFIKTHRKFIGIHQESISLIFDKKQENSLPVELKGSWLFFLGTLGDRKRIFREANYLKKLCPKEFTMN